MRFNKRGIWKYLSEFVYGGIDGSVTTFAVVAGAIGASFSNTVILVLGFANLFADGISMALLIMSQTSLKENFIQEQNLQRNQQVLHGQLSFLSLLWVLFLCCFLFFQYSFLV